MEKAFVRSDAERRSQQERQIPRGDEKTEISLGQSFAKWACRQQISPLGKAVGTREGALGPSAAESWLELREALISSSAESARGE
jgi:hypothetical protein